MQQDDQAAARRRRRERAYGWWFLSIGLGFVLLGFRNLLVGGNPWLVALRFLIAAGFLFLGFSARRSAGERGRAPGSPEEP